MRIPVILPALSAVLAAVLVLGALPAAAQTRPPPPTRPPTLAEQLDLKPDQQEAWRAYQSELALEREDASHGRAQAQLLNGMTTPQRVSWTLEQLAGHDANVRRATAATLAFYQALRPDQKVRFDKITRIPLGPPPTRSAPAGPVGRIPPPPAQPPHS